MSNCTVSMTATAGCLTTSAGVKSNVVIHYQYGKAVNGKANLLSTHYTDAVGVNIVLAAGDVVSAGACPVIAPDVEWQRLCDVSTAGVVTEFERRTITSQDNAGVWSSVSADFGLDRVTPYTSTGTVGACAQDCDVVAPLGVVSTWG